MTSEINRCYRSLELEPGASLEQVKQAWRELVKVWHPDRFPNDTKLHHKAQERLKEINLAYETLEAILTSGMPPASSRSSPSQASDRTRGSKRTETPPQQPPPPPPPISSEQTKNEPKRSRTGLVWAVVGGAGIMAWAVVAGIVVLVLIIAKTGGNSNQSSTLGSSSIGIPSRGGGSGYTSSPPHMYVPPPVSKALDEKNGFKDFKFGMTPQEVRKVLQPSKVSDLPGANAIVFHYRDTAANRIGEFSTDYLNLRFFDGQLQCVDMNFSSFQNEIFEACKVNYGEPIDKEGWKRGDQELKCKAWSGQKKFAAVVSPAYQAWDTLIIYDILPHQKAKEFAAKEPEWACFEKTESENEALS